MQVSGEMNKVRIANELNQNIKQQSLDFSKVSFKAGIF